MAFTDKELREAASHRGLKLVKSRKRKPGAGDYGLFGLTDAGGKPLFGMGDDGLTATPEQIIGFLRKGEVSTWAASAESVPDRPQPAKPDKPASDDEDAPSAIRPRKGRSEKRNSVAASSRQGDGGTEKKAVSTRSERAGRAKPARRRDKTSEPEPTPEPELVVREARPQDAEPLHGLLAPLEKAVTAAQLKRAISSATSRKEPMLVAVKGELIGSVAWHIIPDPLYGSTARIMVIFVAEDQRRQGVGRALYEAALAEIRHRKAVGIEAMSDMEVRNANAFYRAMGLKQASYRFAVEL